MIYACDVSLAPLVYKPQPSVVFGLGMGGVLFGVFFFDDVYTEVDALATDAYFPRAGDQFFDFEFALAAKVAEVEGEVLTHGRRPWWAQAPARFRANQGAAFGGEQRHQLCARLPGRSEQEQGDHRFPIALPSEA